MNGRGLGSAQPANSFRQDAGGAHAPRDRFAVQEPFVARFGLERMAEGVTEIEDAAEIALALIGGDHFSLNADRRGDDAL